jgi:hypothetical protein
VKLYLILTINKYNIPNLNRSNLVEEQRLEAAQMKFLRPLLGITKLDKEKIKVLGKNLGRRT